MASRSLGTLTVDLIAKVGGFTKGMTQAEREAAKSSKAIQARLKKLATGIDAAFKLAAAAAVAAFGAISVGVGNAINRMDDIVKAAQKVGVSSESFSKLAYAAELSGVDIAQLEGAMAKLAKSQDMAAQGSKEQLDIFKALGIEFQRADGTLRSTDEVLADIADKFQVLPDGSSKTAAAMALLGRSGAQLIPLLNGGSEGLATMGDELERLGGVVTPEAARQAEKFNDDITRLKTAANGLWQALAVDLLPDLIKFTDELVESAKEGEGLAQTARDVADGIRAMGTAAQFAVDLVQALTNGVIGLYNAAKGLEQFSLNGAVARIFGPEEFTFREDFRNAGVAFEGVAGAFDNGGSGSTGFDFEASLAAGEALAEQGRQAEAAAVAEKALADALKFQREEQERATAARRADAEARKAASELAKRENEELEAQKKLAEQVYEQQAELRRLAGEERQEREQALGVGRQLLSDLEFELELMKMSNAERATAIQLRGLDAEAVRQYGDAIRQANEEIEAQIEQIRGQDFFRGELKGLFTDVVSGAESAKDAIDSFFDNLRLRAIEALAENLINQLFGKTGTTDGGMAGDGWASWLGSLFGGARADGGPVSAGKAYLVGEEGPELFRPRGAGQIVPAAQTAAMASAQRGGDMTVVIQGATSGRSIERIRIERDRAQRRAVREMA